MTNHVARLYLVALALVAFFLTWAVVAARPWASAAEKDPRLAALERREALLQRQSVRVQRVVDARFARYEVRLRNRREEIAAIEAANAATAAAPAPVGSSAPSTSAAPAAPSVGVVELPPVTNTSSS